MLYVFLIDFSVVFGIWGLKFVSCGWSELGFFFIFYFFWCGLYVFWLICELVLVNGV